MIRHRFHSICPYFAMFPESFVSHWVDALTNRGDIVIDPFSGRGTTAFQALLMDRGAIAIDTNPVAYVLTRAKANAPLRRDLDRRLDDLERRFRRRRKDINSVEAIADQEAFFDLAFAKSTLSQLLYLRSQLDFEASDVDCMLAALTLGALHGETSSPSYLSNQMPRTISTKPAYSVRYWCQRGLAPPERDVFEVLRDRIAFRYASSRPRRRARVFLGDMRNLPRLVPRGHASLAITSPPYLDTTSFEEDQWLRLWFLGGPPRPGMSRLSPDDRLVNRDRYWLFIGDMWRTLGYVVRPGGHVVVRIAGRTLTPDELRDGLEGTSCLSGRAAVLRSFHTSPIVRRQTDSFRPGSSGRATELDCHFQFQD